MFLFGTYKTKTEKLTMVENCKKQHGKTCSVKGGAP